MMYGMLLLGVSWSVFSETLCETVHCLCTCHSARRILRLLMALALRCIFGGASNVLTSLGFQDRLLTRIFGFFWAWSRRLVVREESNNRDNKRKASTKNRLAAEEGENHSYQPRPYHTRKVGHSPPSDLLTFHKKQKIEGLRRLRFAPPVSCWVVSIRISLRRLHTTSYSASSFCFLPSPSPDDTHHMQSSSGKQLQCGQTYDKLTPPIPDIGAMILLKKSVLFHKISCAMLKRLISSMATNLVIGLLKPLKGPFPIARLRCAVRTAHCLVTAICIRTSF